MMRGPNTLRILTAASCSAAMCLAGCAGDASGDTSAPPVEWSADQPPDLAGYDPGVLFPTLAPGDDAGTPDPSAPPSEPVTPPAPDPAAPPSEPAAPSEPAPAPAPAAPAVPSLGALPAELSSIAWPARPRTTREVTVTTAAQLTSEAAVAGTRIHVRGAVGGGVTIAANDVEIDADAATSLGVLSIGQSVSRVRITGGRWGGVRVAIPADFSAGASYRPELMAQDLWFQDVTIDSGGETAYEIRGRRIAIVGNDVTAGRYSIWCGDTGHFQTEDLILLDNVFRSAGPESTVRLVSVLRSAVVSNVITNTYKHNYRIHGVSDLNFAADNLLVTTGVMLGTMEGDSLGRVWFDDNVMHHDAPDLFNPSPTAIRALYARRNTVHANGRAALYEGAVPAGWSLSENVVGPYTAPPAF